MKETEMSTKNLKLEKIENWTKLKLYKITKLDKTENWDKIGNWTKLEKKVIDYVIRIRNFP